MNKWWSFLFGATMLACFALFVISPFMGWWMPKNISTYGGEVDALFYLILAVTAFFFVLTEALLVYFMYQYGSEGAPRTVVDRGPPSIPRFLQPLANILHDQQRVEMAWTVVPSVILLYIAFAQIGVWMRIKDPTTMPSQPDIAVEVSARMYEWRVRYPAPSANGTKMQGKVLQDWGERAQIDDVHVLNEVHVWKGAKVKVFLKTNDVLHSFYLPNLRLKQDALPGKTIPVWFEVTEYNTVPVDKDGNRLAPGQGAPAKWLDGYDPKTDQFKQSRQIWEIACAELCGWGHYKMQAKLYVHETEADYRNWLESARNSQLSTVTQD